MKTFIHISGILVFCYLTAFVGLVVSSISGCKPINNQTSVSDSTKSDSLFQKKITTHMLANTDTVYEYYNSISNVPNLYIANIIFENKKYKVMWTTSGDLKILSTDTTTQTTNFLPER